MANVYVLSRVLVSRCLFWVEEGILFEMLLVVGLTKHPCVFSLFRMLLRGGERRKSTRELLFKKKKTKRNIVIELLILQHFITIIFLFCTWFVLFNDQVLLDSQLPDQIPVNDYYDYFAPDYRLHLEASSIENSNTKEYLDAQR